MAPSLTGRQDAAATSPDPFRRMNVRTIGIRHLLIALGLASGLALAAGPQDFAPPLGAEAPMGIGHHGGPFGGFPDHGKAHGGPGCHGLPLHGLALSEAQQDKVFAILHAQAPQVRQLERTAFKAEQEVRRLGFSAQYDEAKAKSLVDAVAKARGELALLRLRGEHQIYDVLTPEQKRQLSELPSRPGPDADREDGHHGHHDGRR